ncbi:CDGSH iron-sulfur domain-containing protein [Streptomyces sp. AM 2-1-1]|uniref:CDGSH iron-sulfur domain-containing protein n=1 Tax=Streptomyces sp. AM 2-1-1 TaxID=3028709 RepID=UPI0023B9D80A|nr:CDGSH iron-sulfur domain-containing protein [Streptomyces sp. AM 2-1-1]WEH38277.1 CDGSH iron-sulfur domain-containing protein [Streptomyces sp. AM 2-1-1]
MRGRTDPEGAPGPEAPEPNPAGARLVSVDPEGPVLIEGPVTVRLPDGRSVTSERFTVAVCTCRRSRTYPWCDTSHRRREKVSAPSDDARPEQPRRPRSPGDHNESEESAS